MIEYIRQLLKRPEIVSSYCVDARKAADLLAEAKASLRAFLESADPTDKETLSYLTQKYERLARIYAALESVEFDTDDPRFPYDELPDSRELFWDDPKSDLEKRCLEDAERLFHYLEPPRLT